MAQGGKRKWLRRTLGLGLLAGAAYAVWRVVEANRIEEQRAWEPQPFPFPPQPATSERDRVGEQSVWTEPHDGGCPASHPVKAKVASHIFHVPGGQSYDRTRADRCYVDAAAAVADGFRPAKR